MRTGKSRSRSATPGQMSRMSRMVVKLKTVVLNDTPKCRSREARECGSEKLKARKARKVESGESGNVLCSTTLQSVGVGYEK